MLPGGSAGRQCRATCLQIQWAESGRQYWHCRARGVLTAPAVRWWTSLTLAHSAWVVQGVWLQSQRGLHPGDRSTSDIWESGMGFEFRSLCQKQLQNNNSTSNNKNDCHRLNMSLCAKCLTWFVVPHNDLVPLLFVLFNRWWNWGSQKLSDLRLKCSGYSLFWTTWHAYFSKASMFCPLWDCLSLVRAHVHLMTTLGSGEGAGPGRLLSGNWWARCPLSLVRLLYTWSYQLPWALEGSWSLVGENEDRDRWNRTQTGTVKLFEPWVQWFYMRDPSLLWDPLRLFYFELFSVSWKWIVLSDHTISVGMMEARVKLRINWTQILGSLKKCFSVLSSNWCFMVTSGLFPENETDNNTFSHSLGERFLKDTT